MLWITRWNVERFIDTQAVKTAIEAAERRTSGEICVSISPWFWGSINGAAHRAFVRLGVGRTLQRNGVLFFLVPSRRGLVVLGDVGIHSHVGETGWQQVVDQTTAAFKRAEFSAGLIAGIGAVADSLAEHFPFDSASDINELPDTIDGQVTAKRSFKTLR